MEKPEVPGEGLVQMPPFHHKPHMDWPGIELRPEC
jgi:hypothetical protein